jgi:hypothetical protein
VNAGRVLGRATLLYAYLMARTRLQRRSERVLGLLERVLPARVGRRSLRSRSLLVVAACTLGSYVGLTATSGATLFGVLLISSPVTALSLLFVSLLALAASCGLSTASRTISPPDEERLLMAPLSDRRAYALAFGGADPLVLLENLLVAPVISGVAASIALGGQVSLPALWGALALVTCSGCAVALAVDRLVGAAWVRRARRGALRGSLAGYVLFSAIACVSGTLASRIAVSPFSKTPAHSSSTDTLLHWASSLPEGALKELLPLLQVLLHPASPVGAPARWAVGGSGSGLAVTALWTGTLAIAAALLWAGGGGWYREARRGARMGSDLFDLAEVFYTGLGRILYRGDRLVEVQLLNLCRCRKRTVAGPFHLFGGPLLWLWVGLAWGAAPALRTSDEAAAVFALVAGGWAASATVRAPFETYRAFLSLDAEGRMVDLYRAAGVGAVDLYEAKARAGRLLGGVPLLALLVLIVIVAQLSFAAGVILLAVGLASWEVWPRIELLPGLVSPHFIHEHPDEVGTPSEQQELSRLSESAGGAVSLLGFVLAILLLAGWIPPESFPWVAAPAMLAAGMGSSVILRLFGRRAAVLADGMELPP